MSPHTMVALRHAAAIAHALPGVHLRIGSDTGTLLEVGSPCVVDGPAMGPCAFRMAVARGHEMVKQGIEVGFLDLPPAADPHIQIALGPGGAALPGGIYRVTSGEVHLHAATTTLPVRRCRQILADRDVPAGVPEHEGIALRFDAATEITVLHTAGRPGPVADSQLRLLQHALEAVAAEELIRSLARVG